MLYVMYPIVVVIAIIEKTVPTIVLRALLLEAMAASLE